MSEAKQKWDEVGDRFGEIGKRLKERYDASAAFGADQQEKMNDALRKMAERSMPVSPRSATRCATRGSAKT